MLYESPSHWSSGMATKPSIFFAKFRRRRKAVTSVFLALVLLLFTTATGSGLPDAPISPPAANTDCDMTTCFPSGPGPAQQQPNLASLACPALKQLHSCLKTLKCNGNFQYHTFQYLVKNAKRRCREGHGKNNRRNGNSSGPEHGSSQQPSSTPPVRSGDSFTSFQALSKPPRRHHSPPVRSHEDLTTSAPSKSPGDQYCLSAAYNFTIGEPITSSSLFAAYASKSPSLSVANPEELSHLYKAHLLPTDLVRPQSSYHLDGETSFLDPSRRLRSRRDTKSPGPAADPKRRLSEAFRAYFSGRGHRPVEALLSASQPDQQSEYPGLTARSSRDLSESSSPSASAPKLTEMLYKPVAPMTPSLTCMIFGDPHLRTFDSRYQTCNCLGARSLIEHPLFDVQITNTRLQDQFNATGVTKVIVQVRHFSPCSIATDLLYETDSLAQDLPSSTFTDGSTAPSPLIRITTSSEELGLVVTLHLDHIGVRIYISQFTHTQFINVVIKFRTATSASVKQKLVLDAISSISLCKSGCGRREVVDLEATLKSAGIDTRPPVRGVIQEVKKVEDDDLEDSDQDQDQDPTSSSSDEDENPQFGGTYHEDDSDDEPEEYEDGDYDDEYPDEEDGALDGGMAQPQKDPRSKRVKKDAASDGGSSKKRKDKKKDRKNKRNRARDGTNPKRDLPLPTPGPAVATLDAFLALKPTRSEPEAAASSPEHSPAPALSDLVPLHNPTLTDECNEMMDFYRLACLYDTVLKGVASNYPHKFAISFDEPRLAEYGDSSTKVNVAAPSSAGAPSSSVLVMVAFSLIAVTFRL